MTTGKVRVLPPDTPGLPPAVPLIDNGAYVDYVYEVACHALLPISEAQAAYPNARDGHFVCTRHKHDADEVHVCHHLDGKSNPLNFVVWGGE